MIDFLDVNIYSEQPTTCPICGMRSDILSDFYFIKEKTQIHRCPIETCKFEFIMEYDEDFDNGLLL